MKINVLLSTYNGEKYLTDQLESLINQSVKIDEILIRDDGSKDKTIDIIKEYANKYDFIHFYSGNNLGAGKSFWDLLTRCGDADYYAFCDQDDVWMNNKLEKAIELLSREDNNIPLLYCSKYILTDENLNPINSDVSSLYNFSDFEHSLIYHTAPGCTFVLNHKARMQSLKYDVNSEYFIIHDAIIHKVVALFGKIILDKNPYIYYRQHGNNEIGMNANKLVVFKQRVKNFLGGKTRNYRSLTAQSMLRIYGNECEKHRKEIIEIVANYKSCFKYKYELLTRDCFKSHTINDLFFKLLVLVNYV